MRRHAALLSLSVLTVAGMFVGGCQSSRNTGLYELSDFHRTIDTESADAQLWFDRGLAYTFGFNHGEAIHCYEQAAAADPDAAMAHWGVAYALGPHINNPGMDEDASRRAWEALQRAKAAPHKSPLEADLIAALEARYAWPAPADRFPLDQAYARAMRPVYERYGSDPDIAALYAESLMILRPWAFWTPSGDMAPETPEIMGVLERALAEHPYHPALCHFYIHTMEASPTPEKALPFADNLRDNFPSAGHLVHMPSHIDIRLGRYQDAIVANEKAIVADDNFARRRGGMNFYTLYRVHAYHFLVYAAMFDGQYDAAITHARRAIAMIPPQMLIDYRDFLDAFVPMPLHVMVRFGKWDDILAEPRPEGDLPAALALWHYARGVAYAATGRVEEAEHEQELFREARKRVPESSMLFQNSSDSILGVAELMLEGEIEYRKGNHAQAFATLRQAVDADIALNYDEPWGWMQPAAHALGALLLEQGGEKNIHEAIALYEADLERHPNNLWALHGLSEAYRRSDRLADARRLERDYQLASERADVPVGSSCYCRTTPSVE